MWQRTDKEKTMEDLRKRVNNHKMSQPKKVKVHYILIIFR